METRRLRNLQNNLEHPVLIKKKENLLYLTGHSFMRGYLLVKKNDAVFFGDGLEKAPVAGKSDTINNIGRYLKAGETLEIFGDFTYAEGEYLKQKIQNAKLKITAKPDPVTAQRIIKDKKEIVLIKKSMQIVEEVFNLVRREIGKPGMTEARLAEYIKNQGLKYGAEDVSFPPIVAAGANAAVPHHVPGGKKLKTGESIILDFGFKYKNYCSDFTRTVFLKSAPKKLAGAYMQAKKSYNESITACTLQKKANEVYQKSVDVLAEKQLDKYFIHSLGHGTGLEIHELPNLSPASKDVLMPGMVFSIEPGVYFPKTGGIRIEDLVYMDEKGVKKFINVSTKLEDNII